MIAERKVVLVTGASSGIGRRIAARLGSDGYRVYGTSRDARSRLPPEVEALTLDVNSEASVVACVGAVLSREGRLDVLVNNAGIELTGALEECSLEEARAVFDTNFFGMLRATSAALPAMRAAGSGQIINIGSAAGLAAIPFQGIYSASKSAVEAFSEALRHEVERFGISVCVVEPGFHHSELGARMLLARASIDAYREERDRVARYFGAAVSSAPDPDAVARRVSRIVAQRRPGLRHPVGIEAKLCLLKPYLPEWVARRVVRWLFGLERHPLVDPVMRGFYRLMGRAAFVEGRADALRSGSDPRSP